MRALFLTAGLVGVVLGLGAASAQTAIEQRPMTAQERKDWPSVGLITYGTDPDRAICTGTLVAADLVLTAAHCLSRGGVALATTTIRFAAGWHDGEMIASRGAARVILAEGAKTKVWAMASDIALLVLDAPIAATEVPPMALRTAPLPETGFDFIGYRRDDRQLPQIAEDCARVSTPGPLVGLSCAVVSGNSGAPVVVRDGGPAQLAAIVISHGTGVGGLHAYAVIPEPAIRAIIAQH